MNTTLYKILKKHNTGWVSMSEDYKKVIASAQTFKELIKKLNQMGNPNGHIMKATQDYSSYIGV